MASPTVDDIIGLCRDLIRAESDSDVPAIADSFLIKAVSDANLEWLRSYRRGGGNTPIVLTRDGGGTLVSDTAINQAAGVTTATTSFITDDSSNFEASGALVFWDDNMADVAFYTGNDLATTFSGVTQIGFSHEDNDAVQALYSLPSNFADFRYSEEYGDGVRLNGSPLRYMEGPPNPGYFSLVDDGTTKYLWFYRGASGDYSFIYDRKNTTLDSTDDTVDVPEEYQFFLAWRAIEFALFGRGDNFDLIAYAKQQANQIRLQALKDRNVGRLVRVRQLNHPYRSRSDYLAYLENVND